MIRLPLNTSPKQKSNWREKIWRMSNSSSNKSLSACTSLEKTPIGSPNAPSLSGSPTSTPGSSGYGKPDEDLFLTPLDVLDHDHEVNSLLDNQIGMIFGDWNIPPPPPKRKSGLGTNKSQLLPAHALSGPKIKPYFQTSSRHDTNAYQETCFICEDILETKLISEKLVPLECGDCVHGECLRANVDTLSEILKDDHNYEFNNDSFIESKIFPICRGKHCTSEKRPGIIVPIAKDLVSELVADVILSVRLSTIPPKSHSKQLTKTASLVYGAENRVSRHFFIAEQSLRPQSFVSMAPTGRQIISRSVSIANHEVNRGDESQNEALGDIKSLFIKRMLQKYSDFSLVVLVSLGSLRLVDRLQVAIKDEDFREHIVYLFSNFIVIEKNHISPTLFPLDGNHVITTPHTSVIQFVTLNEEVPALTLYSKTDAIIEKWGIALSDAHLILPMDVITSSMNIQHILVEDVYEGKTPIAAKNKFELSLPMKGCPDPRSSLASTIEPKEIWSDRPNNFAQELMKIGVLQTKESMTNIYDTKPTSPLNIVKPQDGNASATYISHPQPFDQSMGFSIDVHSAIASDSDSDLDSDLELINTVMNNNHI